LKIVTPVLYAFFSFLQKGANLSELSGFISRSNNAAKLFDGPYLLSVLAYESSLQHNKQHDESN
jgi:hypothetical protein